MTSPAVDRPAPLVAVPVWGRLDLAERCLRAIDRSTAPDVELLVVDDAGPQRVTTEQVQAWVASGRRLTVVHNPENLGFPATANRVFAHAGSRDVALVNSDVEVHDGWLDLLVQALDSAPRAASASALANDGSLLTVRALSTAGNSLQERTRRLSQRLRRAAEVPLTAEVPVAVGHCVLLKAAALRDVGGFDLVFSPGYGEEVDWSMRARRRGWHHLGATRCLVLHAGGSSFTERLGRLVWVRRRREVRLLLRYPVQVLRIRVLARRRDTDLARALAAVEAVAGSAGPGALGSDTA